MSKLKEIREKKNMSQTQLAKLSGINLRTIQDYEQDKRSINKAQLATVYALAQTLDCTMEELIEFKERKNENEL